MMPIIRSVIFFFCAVFLCTACHNNVGKDYTQPARLLIEVTDAAGHTLSLAKPAQRIVCLFDPAMDNIYMLQVQEKLVGIPIEVYTDTELFHPYSLMDQRIQNKTIPTPGSNETANLESIIQLRPDLLIVQHLPPGAVNTLAQMNIPVYQASATTYQDIVKEMEDIGKLTGKEERAQELLAFARAEYKKLLQRTDTLNAGNRKKAYFSWANGKIFSTTGRSSNMHTILERAGLENACNVNMDQPNISPETLIQWNPDMIIMWNDSPDLFYNKPELHHIEAIKQKQIYNLMPMFFYNPHTLKALCSAITIQHWAYGPDSVGAKNTIQQIVRKFYGDNKGNTLNTLLQ